MKKRIIFSMSIISTIVTIVSFNLISNISSESTVSVKSSSDLIIEKNFKTKTNELNSVIALNYSQNNEKKYVYPITQKNKEWKNLKTNDQKIEASQIPEDLLVEMSTKDLFDSIMDCPIIGNVYLYDEFEEGFNLLHENFNGMRELLKRNDLIEVLLEEYSGMGLDDKELDLFRDRTKVQIIEYILSNKNIQEKMTKVEKKEFINESYVKYMQKQNTEGYKDDDVDFVYESSEDAGTINEFGESEVVSDVMTYVHTPKGTAVLATHKDDQGDPVWIAASDKYWSESYPNAKLASSSDARYNCHSYAWHMQSLPNKFWINDPSLYFRDGSYRVISSSYATSVGQKVLWYRIFDDHTAYDHSGIVYSFNGPFNFKVISKWGKGPLMIHSMSDCPYNYTQIVHKTQNYFYTKAY